MTTGETEPPRRPVLLRVVPLLVMPAFTVLSALLFLRPIGDPDTWWHLRLGQELGQTWNLSDPPAWTRFATSSWVPTQWLPEVVTAWWEGHTGLPGVVWLLCVTVVVIVATTYVVCRREAMPLPAALVTVLAVGAMSPTLTPRPQVVSFVLLLLTVGLWLQTARDLRPRWWLVPLTWLWACCHGLWFSGVAVGAIVALGLWLDRRVDRRRALRLLAVPVLSVFAAGLTPVGPRLLAAPFAVGNISGYITEWQTPSFRDLGPALTAVMVVAVAVVYARSRSRTPWVLIGLVGLAAFWTLLSVRTVTLGAIIVAPLLAGVLSAMLPAQPRERAGGMRTEAVLLATGVVLSMVVAGLLASLLPGLGSPAAVPLGLDGSLDRLPAGTVVVNDYALGGWIDWRHRDLQVVVDGRAEAFGADHLAAYGTVLSASAGWDQTLRSWDAHVAVLAADSALADALQRTAGWRIAASDGAYLLLSDGTVH